MPGMFDDLIPQTAQAGAPASPPPQAAPQVVWVETPAPADYDGKSPKFPPPYAQTLSESQQWEAKGGINEPYARIDPQTGQVFIRTPVAVGAGSDDRTTPARGQGAVPQTGGMFDDLIPSAGQRGPDFHPHDVVDYANDTVRSLARGIPIFGALADKADAATTAALAPLLEGLVDKIPGHDTRYDLNLPGSTFQQRYDRALAMQQGIDKTYDADHPVASTALKVAGGVGSLGAGALYAPAAIAPVSSLAARVGVSGLVPQMAAGATDAALVGGANGYLAPGGAGIFSPERLAEMKREALVSAIGGAALPAAGAGVSAVWKGTGAKLADLMLPKLQLGDNGGAEAASAAPVAGAGTAWPITPAQAARDALPPLSVRQRDASAAYDYLWRSIDRQGQTPLSAVETVKGLGPYGMLADAGPQTRSLADALVNMPGKARDFAQTALDLRQRGQLIDGEWRVLPSSTRIADAAAEGMGLGGRDYYSDLDTLTAQQKAAAGPAYAKAYEAGPQDSPLLQGLATRPSVRAAMSKAYAIAKEEGRNPEALGLVDAEDPEAWASWAQPSASEAATSLKAPGRTPSPGPSLLKFIADGGGIKDPGGEIRAMDGELWNRNKPFQRRLIGEGDSADGWALKAQEAGYLPRGPRPTERDLMDAIGRELRGNPIYPEGTDLLRLELERNYAEAERAMYHGGAVEDVPHPDQYVGRSDPSSPLYEGQRTPQTWDYIKRGLDDVLEGYRDPTTGKLNLDEQGRAIEATRKSLRDELVRLNPAYGEALDAYAGPGALKGAAAQGRAMFREDAVTNAKALEGLSPSERDMYRIGALQALRDRLGNANVTYDAANKAGFLQPAQLDKFRELFPSRQAYADFTNMLAREKTMFDTRAGVGGGSATARRIADAAETEESPLETIGHAAAAIHGDHGSAAHLVGKFLFKGGDKGLTTAQADAAARIMFDMHPQNLGETARGLYEAQRRAMLARMIASTGPSAVAGGVGLYDATRR